MIIVTGGAGLIGSAVVQQLNGLGREDILIVDHLGTHGQMAQPVTAPLHGLSGKGYIRADAG